MRKKILLLTPLKKGFEEEEKIVLCEIFGQSWGKFSDTNKNDVSATNTPIHGIFWGNLYLFTLTLSGLSYQITVRPSQDSLGTFYMNYDLLYMLCRPHLNIQNSAHVDRRVLALDMK